MNNQWLKGIYPNFLRFLAISVCSIALLAPGASISGSYTDQRLRTLSGEKHALKDFQGEVLVVNFWANAAYISLP